jgi:hypothetical protein
MVYKNVIGYHYYSDANLYKKLSDAIVVVCSFLFSKIYSYVIFIGHYF